MATTVTRVLPWRRNEPPPAQEVVPLLAEFKSRHGRSLRTTLITQAYTAAAAAHDGQRRRSGEAYIHHPLAVAGIVAKLGLDDVSVAAALLHDAVEDTGMTLEWVSHEFGPDVAALVDGVTKLDLIEFENREAQQAATVRKMILAMSKDLRVLIIKLADRLHNMRTIAGMPAAKQERSALETLDLYAPLAHRLGMETVKTELEDLAFAALEPRMFATIDHMVAERAPEREIYLTQVLHEVEQRLDELAIPAEVTGRPKHLWSIYEKMVVKHKEFDDIYDLVGLRVIVESVRDCYAALGIIHGTWKPVQGRFKDYIGQPKFNLYQSLHTTVIGPQNKPLEVQLRTREMNARAERGVAAHWSYKSTDRESQKDIAWINRIVDWQQETSDPDEFLENLKIDLDQDEVFVFTPKGEVITLPAGSTPIDFAYAIHTEVGHRCIGARVNNKLATLDTELSSGDSVEIVTSKADAAGPSSDWLAVVASARARTKIKHWFSREQREDAVETGREELVKALRRESLPVSGEAVEAAVERIAESMNYNDRESLHAAIGHHHVSAGTVAGRAARELRETREDRQEQLPTLFTHARRRHRRSQESVGIKVEGFDDLLFRFAKCCTPVPDDEVIGFLTKGRGVSVHRADCANASSLAESEADRLIDVEWDGDAGGAFIAQIEVRAFDRARLLRDVSAILADHHTGVLSSTTHTGNDRVSVLRFELELSDPGHLDALLAALTNLDAVFEAHRVLPGRRAG